MLDSVARTFISGGAVMWPLLAVSLAVWIAMGLRWQLLGRIGREPPARGGAPAREAALWAEAELQRYVRFIHSGIAAAPLLGLLGTVRGMIETFGALTAGDTASGTVAGGISQALVSTQYGLLIAVPAYLASRLLDARATRLRDEYTRLGETAAALASTGGRSP